MSKTSATTLHANPVIQDSQAVLVRSMVATNSRDVKTPNSTLFVTEKELSPLCHVQLAHTVMLTAHALEKLRMELT